MRATDTLRNRDDATANSPATPDRQPPQENPRHVSLAQNWNRTGAGLEQDWRSGRPAARVAREEPLPMSEQNKNLVRAFWKDLYSRDFDRVASYFDADSHYEDVPAPDSGADGPANIVKRLKIGLEPIERYVHHEHRLIAEGDTVITEHTEDWHWHTGESVSLPFVSIQVIENGRIKFWRDYWDLSTLMNGAPQWWLERLAGYSQADFSD